MMLGLVGLLTLGVFFNIIFYEYRVQKIPSKPKMFDFTGETHLRF